MERGSQDRCSADGDRSQTSSPGWGRTQAEVPDREGGGGAQERRGLARWPAGGRGACEEEARKAAVCGSGSRVSPIKCLPVTAPVTESVTTSDAAHTFF